MNLRETLKLPKSINDKPVIAVPLTLGPTDKLTPFAKGLQEKNPDIVEWRADYIADEFSQAMIWQQVKVGAQAELAQKDISAMTEAKMLAEMDRAQEEFNTNWPVMNQQIIKELVGSVFQTIGSFPIMLTYRTREQGGKGELSPIEYTTFVVSALRSGYHFAAVDVEYTIESGLRDKIIEAAHQASVPVILSYHDMNETPNAIEIFTDMAKVNADILRITATPKNIEDVQKLLEATKTSHQQIMQPLIATSTGEMGRIASIKGYQYGSEMTFAMLNQTVANVSEQLTVDELYQAWQSK